MLTRLRLAIARWIAPFPYSVHTTVQCLDWANDLQSILQSMEKVVDKGEPESVREYNASKETPDA